MQVARCLGVDWLWIDSLCIVQDSAEDWQRESSQMGRIYRNGLCNIAATGAAEGDKGGGLFPEASIVASQLFLDLSILRPGDKAEPSVSGPRDARTFHRYRLRPWSLRPNKVDGAALNQRGWVVQERALAPRTLHFGSTQAFWECAENVACESLPDSMGLGEHRPVTRFSTIRLVLAAARVAAASSQGVPARTLVRDWADVREAWLQLTQSYIQCLLTKEKDRLVALSGIAKEIRAMTGDEYIAGNWKSMVIESMLWHNTPDGTRLARTRPLEAPTWSWPSIKPYALVYQYQFRTDGQPEPEQLVEYVSHDVSPYGADDTGQLHSARLQVRGRLFSGVEEARLKSRACDCRSCKPKSPFFPRHEDAVDMLGWRFFHRAAYHDEDGLAESAGSTLQVLYLPVVAQRDSLTPADIEIGMLMLKPNPAATGFERIGKTASVTKMSVSDELLDDFIGKYRRPDGLETITLV